MEALEKHLLDKKAAVHDNIRDVKANHATFHLFSRLPPELRRHIWQLYCPELTLESRLLDITVSPASDRHADHCERLEHEHCWTAKDGRILDAMTLTRRRVLAVNHESRGIALQAFPDYLSLDLALGTAIVRFNKDTDLVLLTGFGMDYHAGEQYHFPDFADKITQLAISSTFGTDSSAANPVDVKMDFLMQFPNLKRAFFLLESLHQHRLRNLQWCVPGLVHEYFVNVNRTRTEQSEDKETGEGDEIVFCWPDPSKHRDPHHPCRRVSQVLADILDEEGVDQLLRLGVESYPMSVFNFKPGVARYKRLQGRLRRLRLHSDSQSDGSSSITTSDEATSDDEEEVEMIDADALTDYGDSSSSD